jgi:hypothetical protein
VIHTSEKNSPATFHSPGSWKEYLKRYPKDQYETKVESWRQIQSQNIEFTMRRLREPKQL